MNAYIILQKMVSDDLLVRENAGNGWEWGSGIISNDYGLDQSLKLYGCTGTVDHTS